MTEPLSELSHSTGTPGSRQEPVISLKADWEDTGLGRRRPLAQSSKAVNFPSPRPSRDRPFDSTDHCRCDQGPGKVPGTEIERQLHKAPQSVNQEGEEQFD